MKKILYYIGSLLISGLLLFSGYQITLAIFIPTIDIVATDDIINADERTSTVTLTGANLDGSTVTLNGNAAVVSGTTWSYLLDTDAINALGQGTTTLVVVDVDTGFNIATGTRDIFIDTIAPTVEIVSIGYLSADTGASSTDFITSSSTQTISATLSAPLSEDEILYGSIDSGNSWVEINSMVSGTTITWTGVDLSLGSTAIEFQVRDTAGNSGPTITQPFTLNIYSGGEVLINEFLVATSTGEEWYELINNSWRDIDLTGWTLNSSTTGKIIPLSGILHQNGISREILVFSTTTDFADDDGDLISLNDDSANVIHSVSYGTVTTDPELLIPYITSIGIDEVAYIPDPTTFVFPNGTYSTTSSPSKGWFNNAGQNGWTPTLMQLDVIPGGDSNIELLDNPSATPATEGEGALYFEIFGMGKIVFEQILNLTNPATVGILGNLSNYMEMTGGHVKFSSLAAADMSALGAKIYMYGFPYAETPDIIIRGDDGEILGINDPSVISNINYASTTGTLSFNVEHFTQFDVPNDAAVDADYEALTEDSIKGPNESLASTTMPLSILPTSGSASSSDISWESSNSNVVSIDGQFVVRPAYSEGDTEVTLTATITNGFASTTKVFNLIVLKLDPSNNITIGASTSTITLGEGFLGTIGNVVYGTSKDVFLADLTKDQPYQTWDTSGITDPVVADNVLIVTAEDGITTATYTVSSLVPPVPTNLQTNPASLASSTRPTLSWDAVISDPVVAYYEIYVYYSDDEDDYIESSTTAETSYTLESSLSDNDYFWIVRACTESSSCSNYSSNQYFTIDTNPPSVSSVGDSVTDYQLPFLQSGLYGVTLIFNEKLSEDGRQAVQEALSAGSDKELTFRWNDNNGGDGTRMRMSVTGDETATFNYDVFVNTTDLAGNTSTDLLLVDSEDPAQTALSEVLNVLSNMNIASNINTVTSLNATNFSGLYFEKRTDVNDRTTAIGRITFDSSLDLSNPDTQIFLQNLGDELNISNNGSNSIIGFDLSTSTASTFADKSATIKFYGLSNLGFGAGTSADEINSKFFAYDDDGVTPIATSTLISEPGTYLGACEVGGSCYVFTIGVNHFTTYKIDNSAKFNSFSLPGQVGTAGIDDSNHTITVLMPNGTDISALTAVFTINGSSVTAGEGVPQTSGETVNDFSSPITYYIAGADNSNPSYLVTAQVLSDSQTSPDESGDVTMSSSTPEVVITNPDQAVNITISSDTEDPTIDVSEFITDGEGILPEITINSDSADIAIPAGVTVSSASTTWNGVIEAPTITTVTLPETSGQTKTLSTAIEIGFSGVELTFNKAVRILLPEQAGKRVGYVRTGIDFTEITDICSADTQVAGDALDAGAECKKDVGSDLVIWTKHFTTFAAYSQTVSSSHRSSGGGGGGMAYVSPVIVTATTTIITATSTIATSTQSITTKIISIPTTTISGFMFTGNLKLGSKGNEVVELQKILVAGKYLVMPSGVAYGVFGNATKAAVIKYQKEKGLPQEGTVGPMTRKLLNSSNIPASSSVPTSKPPSSSNVASMTLKQLIEMLLQINAIAADKIDAAKKLINNL